MSFEFFLDPHTKEGLERVDWGVCVRVGVRVRAGSSASSSISFA